MAEMNTTDVMLVLLIMIITIPGAVPSGPPFSFGMPSCGTANEPTLLALDRPSPPCHCSGSREQVA
jgi:hypothetical protein